MTAYTRTRADYERMIIHLTPEQTKVLSQIKLDSDFLVKGAEGAVRISTLHSARGFDFPVVFLFLPRRPWFGSGDSAHESTVAS
jgi:superfamily I DNA/RNA helicase